MFLSPMLSVLVSCVAASGDQAPPGEACWKLDKTVVMSGGCVTLTLDDTCSKLRGLKLRIDDDQAIDAMTLAGPKIHRQTLPGPVTTTLILVSHDFRGDEAFELVAQDPQTYRWVPIFDVPGAVRLTLESPDRGLGTKTVTVVPAPPDARPAVELLFPEHIKDQGRRDRGPKFFGLVLGTVSGPPSKVQQSNLAEFQRQLTVVRAHPDWREIGEMVVAGLEARVDFREVRESLRGRAGEVIDEGELPPLPEAVTTALKQQLKSPFAKALQDNIRQTVGTRKFLLDPDDPLRQWGE